MFDMGSTESIVGLCILIMVTIILTVGGIMKVANNREGATDVKVSHFSRQIRTIEHDGHQFVAVILPSGPGTIRNIIHHPSCECIK